jgi:hypothetical protein
MSAVLLAMFDQYKIAERVRVELVRDGFPTDRVELTAACEPGRAGLEPAESAHERFVQYFRVLFTLDEEQRHPEQLARRLDTGAATEETRPWIIATAVLCLWLAAYLVNKQAFGGIAPSESSLQQTQYVSDETGPPYEGHTPSPYISAVIRHYFDTYLAELHLARQGTGYTRLADHDDELASCLAGMPCGGLYDTGRTALSNF